MDSSKKKILITNLVLSVSVILDIIIALFVNYFSNETINILATHNIIMFIIFILLVIAFIVCNIVLQNNNSGVRRNDKKRLQKAFQNSGGYETIADEMIKCIRNHDYKSAKDVKRILDIIEK